MKTKSYQANPYFDDLLVFEKSVPTSQDKFKPHKCDNCTTENLYQSYSKKNKTDFVQEIKNLLNTNLIKDWPYSGNILIQFSISDTPQRIKEIDLDNLAKTVIDSLKDTVFKDDNQIIAIVGDKHIIDTQDILKFGTNDGVDHKELLKTLKERYIQAFMVAIRKLDKDERPLFQQFLFGGQDSNNAESLDPSMLKTTNFIFYGGTDDKKTSD